MPKRFLTASLVAITLPATSLANTSAGAAPGGGPFLWPLVATTAILVAIVLALGYFARRFGSRFRTQETTPIQIIGARSLGTRERVVLLQVGDQQVLVGATPTQVNTLLVSDSPLVPAENAAVPATPKFAATLSGMLKRGQS